MLVISHISVYLAQVSGTFVFLVQLNFLSLCLKIIKYDLIVIESAAAAEQQSTNGAVSSLLTFNVASFPFSPHKMRTFLIITEPSPHLPLHSYYLLLLSLSASLCTVFCSKSSAYTSRKTYRLYVIGNMLQKIVAGLEWKGASL